MERVGMSFLSQMWTKTIYPFRGVGGFAATLPEWVYVFHSYLQQKRYTHLFHFLPWVRISFSLIFATKKICPLSGFKINQFPSPRHASVGMGIRFSFLSLQLCSFGGALFSVLSSDFPSWFTWGFRRTSSVDSRSDIKISATESSESLMDAGTQLSGPESLRDLTDTFNILRTGPRLLCQNIRQSWRLYNSCKSIQRHPKGVQ